MTRHPRPARHVWSNHALKERTRGFSTEYVPVEHYQNDSTVRCFNIDSAIKFCPAYLKKFFDFSYQNRMTVLMVCSTVALCYYLVFLPASKLRMIFPSSAASLYISKTRL